MTAGVLFDLQVADSGAHSPAQLAPCKSVIEHTLTIGLLDHVSLALVDDKDLLVDVNLLVSPIEHLGVEVSVSHLLCHYVCRQLVLRLDYNGRYVDFYQLCAITSV